MTRFFRRVVIWIRTLRAPFFQAVIVPAVLGSAIAWYETGAFYWGYFLLALAGVVCVNAGTNLANDYFDYTSGNDDVNTENTTFSGGSRTIQEDEDLVTTSHDRRTTGSRHSGPRRHSRSEQH